MDCSEAQELIAPYFLGALEPAERTLLEEHLNSCSECSDEAGEAAAALALSVEQVPVPAGVKENLFARIDRELKTRPVVAGPPSRSLLSRLFSPDLWMHPATAAAGVLLVVVIVGGVLFNARVSTVARENDELRSELGAVATAGAQPTARLDEELAHMVEEDEAIAERVETVATAVAPASPGTRFAETVVLAGRGRMSNSRAMVLMTDQGAVALLAALDLPPLPADKVYQVWLIKGSQRLSAGVFKVDPSGYGHTLIRLVAPLGEFDAMAITVEPLGGSRWPTSTTILAGDL